MIWWRNLEDWEEKFERRIPQPRVALGVVSKLPAAFPSPKLNRSCRVYHISCYWMNIQVDPTSSNLATAMLNSKIRPRAVVGYGVKISHPSPPNYVTRSPSSSFQSPVKIKILRDVRFNTPHYKIDFSREQAKRVSCYQWKRQSTVFSLVWITWPNTLQLASIKIISHLKKTCRALFWAFWTGFPYFSVSVIMWLRRRKQKFHVT